MTDITRVTRLFPVWGWMVIIALLLGAISTDSHAKQPAQPAPKAAKAAGGLSKVVGMKTLGNPDGYTLKTVRSERRYSFTRPKSWRINPQSTIQLSFQHSPSLLPERSHLNIQVNNRILKTVRLTQDNVKPTRISVAIPPSILKDRNEVAFQVDQHYTNDCEDPFSPELWTTLLPESYLKLGYSVVHLTPELAQMPYPYIDDLAYDAAKIGYALPTTLSDESLSAGAKVAVWFGQQAQWRDINAFLAPDNLSTAKENLIVIGTPEENKAIGTLKQHFSVKLNDNGFVDKDGKALSKEAGVIQLLANPSAKGKAILVVSGNSAKGVLNAANYLVQNPANKLMTGKYVIVQDQRLGKQVPFRHWDGFLQGENATFNELGFQTLSTRGITALPIFYKLKIMPDVYQLGRQKAVIKTIYSYSSQVDGSQSKLEVRVNGKSIKSIPLDNPKGESQAVAEIKIPPEDLHTFNDVEYQFFLYPDKFDACRFVTDAHLWGTIHNTSSIKVPSKIQAPMPDLGLLNDGGYPFSAHQDFSDVSFVLPKILEREHLQTFLSMLTRFGKESRSQSGIRINAFHEESLPEDLKRNNHLIAIGQIGSLELMNELQSKLMLVIAETRKAVMQESPNKLLSKLDYKRGQGILEELVSPWNSNRVILLATGETKDALKHLTNLFSKDKLFGAIGPGNVLVMNQDASTSVTLLKKGEARFMNRQGGNDSGLSLPQWGWFMLYAFAVFGLFSLLRLLFLR